MSAQRHKLAVRLLGETHLQYDLGTPQSGWPTVATIGALDGRERIGAYVANVTTHARREYERRFQNPAQEGQRLIRNSAATFPLLLGLHEENGQAVCVGADAVKRANNTNRFSVLFNVSILETARRTGWAEYLSRDDERIVAFSPQLLPVYLAYRKLGFNNSTSQISDVLRVTSYEPSGIEEVQERGRQATTRVVRDWRFSRDVVQAYQGRCAISGMNWRIVQAAHIYPVSAPGSADAVSNGVALSPGHHALFDRHRIYIDPASYEVRFHPELFEGATEPERQFLGLAEGRLRTPAQNELRPAREMLERRYDYFGEAYSWAN